MLFLSTRWTTRRACANKQISLDASLLAYCLFQTKINFAASSDKSITVQVALKELHPVGPTTIDDHRGATTQSRVREEVRMVSVPWSISADYCLLFLVFLAGSFVFRRRLTRRGQAKVQMGSLFSWRRSCCSSVLLVTVIFVVVWIHNR